MKMQTVKALARILEIISRIIGIFFMIISGYAISIILLEKFTSIHSLPVKNQNGYSEILIPFTNIPLLLGDLKSNYFLFLVLVFLIYGIYLWILGKVFKAFKMPKLFTENSVNCLKVFFLSNLILPFLFSIMALLLKESMDQLFIVSVLHFILAIFSFFIAAIFKQGLILQNDQDLTL